MNTLKSVKECLGLLVSVREEDSDGLASLKTSQLTALAKLEGKLEAIKIILEENK